MGEYHTRLGPDGQPELLCKLGVCDDLRYVRREEALRLVPLDAGANTDIAALLADERSLWRFPWPDEDQARTRQIDQRDMFRTWLFTAENIDCTHGQRCVSIYPEGTSSGWNVNVFIPCPRRAGEAGLKTSPVAPLFNIYGERWRAGQARTIFRCAWCGQPISLDSGELLAVQDEITREAAQQEAGGSTEAARFLRAVAERLRPRVSGA
jgi:hypothetical protein